MRSRVVLASTFALILLVLMRLPSAWSNNYYSSPESTIPTDSRKQGTDYILGVAPASATIRAGTSRRTDCKTATVSVYSIGVFNQNVTLLAHVVINEFEQNPPTGTPQFVELYNRTSQSVEIGYWILLAAHEETNVYVYPADAVILAHGFWQTTFTTNFLHNEDSLILLNSQGQKVDETPILSDTVADSRSWQRYPDGSTVCEFAPSSPDAINVPEHPFPMILTVLTITAAFVLSRRKRRPHQALEPGLT